MSPRILQCHSRGDQRFSPFYAIVDFAGIEDTIENHYQLSKRFGRDVPKTWRDSKNRYPTHYHIAGLDLDVCYGEQFYKLLWLFYFDNHPELVSYAKTFDGYYDLFAGKSFINQAVVIEQYMKEGRDSILNECKDLIRVLTT